MFPIHSPALLKRKAREALKRNFSAALMIAFISALPGLMMQVFFRMTLLNLIRDPAFQNALYLRTIKTSDLLLLIADKGGWFPAAGLVCLGLTVLTAFLPVSQANAELRLLRGQSITAGDVLSRAQCFVRAILLQIFRFVITLLWLIPGFALTTLGTYLAVAGGNPWLGQLLMQLGFVVSLMLGLRAHLRYRLAVCVMADEPEQSFLECARESKRITAGFLGYLFILILSFLWIYLLCDLVTEMLFGSIPVAMLTLSMLVSLALSLYMDTTVCAFYDVHKGVREAAVDPFVKAEGTVSDSKEGAEEDAHDGP